MLKQLAEGVHVVEGPQRFFGIEMGTRMTVLETDDGPLVYSPMDLPIEVLGDLGPPRWVLAPNLFHHLYVGPWVEAGIEGWAARGLDAKRPDVAFHGVVEAGSQPFGPDVQVFPLTCMDLTNEVVLFHRPSRTLVVTDLVINIPATAPLMTRIAMACACGYPGCSTSVLERAFMKRAVARREIAALLELDFDRLILSHGEVIEEAHGASLQHLRLRLEPMCMPGARDRSTSSHRRKPRNRKVQVRRPLGV